MPNAVKNTISVLSSYNTLLAAVQFSVYQDSYVLFCRAAFHLSGPQHVLMPRWVQNSALLVELNKVPDIPPLQPIKFPMEGHAVCWYDSDSLQFLVICEFIEGALSPIMKMLNKTGPSTSSWNTLLITDLQLTRLCTTEQYSLGSAIRPMFDPLYCLLVHPI